MTELKHPDDLGGFQNIVTGFLQAGDRVTFPWPSATGRAVEEILPMMVGMPVEHAELMDFIVYRKLDVPKQGGERGIPAPACAGPSNVAKARTLDDGKAPLSTLPPAGIEAVAMVQLYGHKKYGDFNNYRKGMEHSRQLSCAIRHIMAHMNGETKDPESGELHLAHAACRLLFLIQNIKDGVDIDDRYKQPTNPSNDRPCTRPVSENRPCPGRAGMAPASL